MGAKPSAPSGAERPLQSLRNEMQTKSVNREPAAHTPYRKRSRMSDTLPRPALTISCRSASVGRRSSGRAVAPLRCALAAIDKHLADHDCKPLHG
jgi:hypothetical protein